MGASQSPKTRTFLKFKDPPEYEVSDWGMDKPTVHHPKTFCLDILYNSDVLDL